jgi:tyrosyl-tRNA synthetase
MATSPFATAFAALLKRGVFSDATPHLGARLGALLSQPRPQPPHAPPSVYAGFDPTAPSLHLGHVSVLMALLRLQRAGLRPIALVGGATALIGDPTGRSADRPQLPREAVAANAARLRALLEPLLGSEGGSGGGSSSSSSSSSAGGAASGAAPPALISTPAATTRAPAPLGCLVVDNAAHYEGMGVLDFMRDVGAHFRLSQLLARDSVKGRMGWSGGTAAAAAAAAAAAGAAGAPAGEGEASSPSAGMSFTEFSYSLFQAHDFWVLHQRHGAVLQIGGSDQWGNITAGVELIRRHSSGSTAAASATAAAAAVAHGAVVPLLTNSAGKKFGKSDADSSPLWLDAALTSHHALWQYLQGVEDGEVLALLRTLTLVEEEELAALAVGLREAPHLKAAQLRLADEVVGWLRGPAAVQEARRTAKLLFAGSAIWGSDSPSEGSSSGSSGSSGGGAFLAQRSAFATLRHSDLESLAQASGVARAAVPTARALSGAFTVVDALVALELVKSKSEARRLVEGGGVYWNWERVGAARGLLASDFVEGKGAVVNVGRKRSGVVLLVD